MLSLGHFLSESHGLLLNVNPWAWIRMSILGKYPRYTWSLSTMRLQFLLYRCAQYWKMLKTNALFCFRLWKSDCCFLNHPESISMNSLFSSPTTQTYFPNTYIFIHSFIHSFIHQTLRGASLCDYFKWKCCKYKPYHYLSEGQCLHILHLCLSPYCWQPKKKKNTALFYLFVFLSPVANI